MLLQDFQELKGLLIKRGNCHTGIKFLEFFLSLLFFFFFFFFLL